MATAIQASAAITPVTERQMELMIDAIETSPANGVVVPKNVLRSMIVELERLRELNDNLVIGAVRVQIVGPGFTEPRPRG